MKKIQMKWERNGYTLRTFEDGKAEKYYQDCFTKTDTEVYRLTGTAGAFTPDQIIQYYDRIVDDPARYDFIITDPNGTYIGESVINEIDWEVKSANFRIIIFDSGNCSKGIGTWAVQCTRDFAFEKLKLHRLELDVFSFNHRARNVYQKAGFKTEGIRRDAIFDNGKYADDILMAILEDDWRELKNKQQK